MHRIQIVTGSLRWLSKPGLRRNKESKIKSPLRTPNIVGSDITPDQIRASKVSDPTLARIRTACEEEVIKGNAKYFKKKDLI